MTVKQLIIHSVERQKDGDPVNEKLRSDFNPLQDTAGQPIQSTINFAEALVSLFASTNADIGEFGVNGDNTIQPPFEQRLSAFYPVDDCVCTDFVTLTQELAIQYKHIIEKPNLQKVKGGVLVFVQYEARGKDLLAVAVLHKTEGFDSSSSLDVVPTEIFDLSKLHQAAAINLTQWKKGLNNRYIKFRAGKQAELRDYFEEFIGCQRDKHAAQLETKGLKDAIHKFGTEICGYDSEETSGRVGRAHDFIKERQKSGDPVLLSELANYVFPEHSEDFANTARNEHNLSEELAIDNKTLRNYKKISVRGSNFSMTFDREMVGKDIHLTDDGGLKLNPEMISDALREQIQEELDERQAKD